MFTRPRWALRNLTFVLLAIGVSNPASAQLVLYDDFNSKHIDTSKWIGLQFYDSNVREVLRDLAARIGTAGYIYPKWPIRPRLITMAACSRSTTVPRSSR
jgi:hypothetical protein